MSARRWVWLLWLLAWARPAAAEVVARGVETFPVGGLRLVPAAGTPAAGLCTTLRAGMAAAGDGGSTLYLCDGAGTWNPVASGPGGGLSAAGTTYAGWTVNTDAAAGTLESPPLTIKAGDGALLHTVTATLTPATDLLTWAYPLGSFAFSQAVGISGGLTLATGDLVLSAPGALVDNVDVGALATSFAAFTSTTAATLTINSDAAALVPETAKIVLDSATGAAVLPVTIEANSAGPVYLYVDLPLSSVPGTVVIGPPGDFSAASDVDQSLTFRGHQAADAVGVATTATVKVDSSMDKLLLTPPTGGATSITAGNLELAALAQVDGRDVSVDGSKLDGIQAGADDVDAAAVSGAGATMAATLAVATAPDEGALLVGSSQTGTGYGDGATVEARIDDLAGDVGTVAGAAITDHGGLGGLGDDDHTQYALADGTRAFGGAVTVTTGGIILTGVGDQVDGRDLTTDGSKLDGIEAGADVTDATNVGAAGALMGTTCAAANTVWGCTADDTPAVLTPAQVRAAAAIQDWSLYQPPGLAGAGTLTNTTLSLALWDATERLPYVLVTASGDSATAEIGWSFQVPAAWSAWDTNFLEVGFDYSDATGNNNGALTCKDTAGVTVLTAHDIVQSTTAGWQAITAASLGAGTYTAGGTVSCLLTVTLDTADTVRLYGLRWYWTH